MIPDEFLNDLKSRLDIVEVIGSRIELKRCGSSLTGLCPFHNDGHASLSVSPARGVWKCFSCNVGGDALAFAAKFDRAPFPDTVKRLAESVGLTMPEREETPEQRAARTARENERRRLLWVNTIAQEYFTRALAEHEHHGALAYLHGRGITDATIADRGIGYAPGGFGALRRAIFQTAERAKEGAGQKAVRAAVAAGLLRDDDKGDRPPFERFRERIMIPIRDAKGETVGFGGRTLADDPERKLPKYLNTAETAIFQKRALLFGLDRAAPEIRDTGTAVLVEGYFDVIACHAAGVGNAIACMGTALTDEHTAALKRAGARSVVLMLDSDAAGQKATDASTETCLRANLATRIAKAVA